MSNGKIFYNNLIEIPTLSVTSEAPGFEKEYLGNKNQGVVWRSQNSAADPEPTVSMAFTNSGGLPLAVEIAGVVVLNHNLQEGDELYFECSDNAAFDDTAPNVVDSTENIWEKGFAEVAWNQPYYRLRTKKNTTGDDYVQVGEIYLVGKTYAFERNYRWNYSFTKEINRNSKETTSGQIYRKTRFIRKGFSLDFDGMNDAQKETFETISENDYICFLPTGSGGDIYYGIIDFSSYTHVYSNYWSANITFTENPK